MVNTNGGTGSPNNGSTDSSPTDSGSLNATTTGTSNDTAPQVLAGIGPAYTNSSLAVVTASASEATTGEVPSPAADVAPNGAHDLVANMPTSSTLVRVGVRTAMEPTETEAESLPDYVPFAITRDVLSLDWHESESPARRLIWQEDFSVQHLAVGTTAIVSTSLSVGYIVWMLRGGSLFLSFVSSLPAWCAFDPLPIVETFEEAQSTEDTEESLSSLVGQSQPQTR